MRTLALSLPGSAPLQAQTRRRPSSERAGRNLVSFFFASVSLKTTLKTTWKTRMGGLLTCSRYTRHKIERALPLAGQRVARAAW